MHFKQSCHFELVVNNEEYTIVHFEICASIVQEYYYTIA
jgi:hypothetical protein